MGMVCTRVAQYIRVGNTRCPFYILWCFVPEEDYIG
jgi:hypothetical protein